MSERCNGKAEREGEGGRALVGKTKYIYICSRLATAEQANQKNRNGKTTVILFCIVMSKVKPNPFPHSLYGGRPLGLHATPLSSQGERLQGQVDSPIELG